jgi:hypothetical protein
MPVDFQTSISVDIDGRHGPFNTVFDNDYAYVIGNKTEKKNYCWNDSAFFNDN